MEVYLTADQFNQLMQAINYLKDFETHLFAFILFSIMLVFFLVFFAWIMFKLLRLI